ncbi:unnamed protein product [Ambrosiozyma monospora]|uniref:Unnamed protein product n=1 Tax=Ambrosiozyma monospora TaxID=43982 RepID=A0ACB5TDY7_AMBMO|nr:unnamed protein product [Ambrosiozyma monospora]
MKSSLFTKFRHRQTGNSEVSVLFSSHTSISVIPSNESSDNSKDTTSNGTVMRWSQLTNTQQQESDIQENKQ